MSDNVEQHPEDCVSRKPWSEVLSRSAKLFVHGAARESGRSLGKALFFLIAGIILIGLASVIIDQFTGWFTNMFDWWPFGGSAEPEQSEASQKWYCRFGNPLCKGG